MRVLILGGGQLALMLIWAAQRLPARIAVYDEAEDAPALRLAETVEDPVSAVEDADVVTYEFENVPLEAAEAAERAGKLKPPLLYLRVKRDRALEREFLEGVGVPVPRWRVVQSAEEALKAAASMGRAVVKVPSGAYDGKGVFYYPSMARGIAGLKGRLIVEEYVDVARELSIIVARGEDGDAFAYPAAENYYVDGILVWNYAPVEAPEEALEYALKIAEAGKYVGVLAVEFFEARDGRVLVNEIAPRVHNTGHWTMETDASQFENHMRAVTGRPLRRPSAVAPTAMVNILGRRLEELPLPRLEALGKVYWYGKGEARPRRKMGHVNVVGRSAGEAKAKAREALKLIYGGDFPRLVLKPRGKAP
ncbi:MAG: 5-(carboxyamino)imidazole ribonucleotide synthase [Thermoproteus sp. AZ2]|uniref:5-(Carboxyamino)imidazole ribonucleotide synthase n=1 Tax=Thermoproteus sp. AZ2 TaxID=1609232 RepID=A0ACC6V388_9CREN